MDFNNLIDTNILEELYEKECEEFEEYEYWTKYFKLGIINGIRLKNDVMSVISNKKRAFFITMKKSLITKVNSTLKSKTKRNI